MSGLWARMEQYVEHPAINYWCACHRSDLAMEDVMQAVLELKLWNSQLMGLLTYYHTSGLHTKELGMICPKMRAFPAHHEVRFAHLIQICEAVLYNLDGCQEHWKKISEAPHGEHDKREISHAKGFSMVWEASSLQTWLTAFMVDMCSLFRYIEKESQKPEIIIKDILRYRDITLQKLELLEERPYPGEPNIL